MKVRMLERELQDLRDMREELQELAEACAKKAMHKLGREEKQACKRLKLAKK